MMVCGSLRVRPVANVHKARSLDLGSRVLIPLDLMTYRRLIVTHFPRWIAPFVLLGVATLAVSPAAGRPVPEQLEKTSLATVLDKSSSVEDFMITLSGGVFTEKISRKTGKGQRVTKDLKLYFKRQDGEWLENVSGVAPGFNQAATRGKILTDKSDKNTVSVMLNIGSDRWVEGDASAPYTIEIRVADGKVEGTYKGTFQGHAIEGDVSGVVRTGGWVNCTQKDGVIHVELNMGTKRVNWNNARWAVNDLGLPVDLSEHDGLVLTVETDKPRHDAWVDLGLMENDGSWYYLRDAAPLTQKSQTVVVDFDDFRHAEWVFNAAGTGPGADGNFDEDFHLDRKNIARIAIGTVNANGVGTVKFRVTDISLGKWKTSTPDTDKVTVSGKTCAVNGAEDIPDGIFGFHTAGGSDEQVSDLRVGSLRPLRAMSGGGAFVAPPNPKADVFLRVSTNYDRRQQVPPADWGANWAEKCKSVGRKLGQAAKPYGDQVAVEWWNEPYLDLGRMLPASVARHADKDQDRTPGKPVYMHGKKLESMVWTKVDGKVAPRDPSRFTYWSGRQLGIFYTDSFDIVATEAKKIAPEMDMVGGFGFRWQEDDWAAWELLYKPMIDRTIENLDGVCEHHYQGHTDAMAASYEVLVAYGMAKHGKRLIAYNTETNDLWDAPARGRSAATTQFGGKFKARKRLIYNVRDILYCAIETPDKIRARAIHALWGGAKDNRVKIGQEIRDRRGRLKLTVTGATWADSAKLGGQDVTAEKGKILLILDVKAWSQRGRGVPLGDVTAKIGSATARVTATGGSFPEKLKKNQAVEAKIAFALPKAAKDDGIVTWNPGGGMRNIVHVHGPFKEADIAPHRRAGIDEGEYVALQFLKELRGRLVAAESSNELIWVASSIDPRSKALVAVVYNDDYKTRSPAVQLKAPAGTSFVTGAVEYLVHDDDGEVGIRTEKIQRVGDKACAVDLKLPAAHAAKIVLRLKGSLPDSAELTRTQTFCKAPSKDVDPILHEMDPGESLSLPITLSSDAHQSKRAWIRLVVERVGQGEGTVEIAGKTFIIPRAHTPCNGSYIRSIEIDPNLLKGVKELTFKAADAKSGNGFLLGMASIVTEK